VTVNELVTIFASINDRAELIAFLAPLRLPHDLSDNDKSRITHALIGAASRCWRGRISG
jgi:hypothetical protein